MPLQFDIGCCDSRQGFPTLGRADLHEFQQCSFATLRWGAALMKYSRENVMSPQELNGEFGITLARLANQRSQGKPGLETNAHPGCPEQLYAAAGTRSLSPVSLKQRRIPPNLPDVEPFVGPDVVAWYLDIDPATVVRYAERGIIPGHPLVEAGTRMHWRFLISEIKVCMLAKQGPKRKASVRSQAQGKRTRENGMADSHYDAHTDALRASQKGA